jgi:phospholipase/carboxylesterase
MPLESIIIEPKQQPATHAIIWLHGLGASGDDFVPIVPQLQLPESLAIRFIFPNAPVRPVTLNMGMPMPAWYDIFSLNRNSKQDEKGIHESSEAIQQLIKDQNAKGIRSDNIILAGFSQGGAIALHTALHYPEKLAGVMALSCYLPLHETFGTTKEKANEPISIFMAHGASDAVVPFAFAELSKRMLLEHHYSVQWHTYPMEHSVCLEEIKDIGAWVLKTFE